MDNLLKALGLTGIDKSKVSRICKELDQAVEHFRERKLQESYPYVWLDALYLKVRQNHRVVSLALVIAVGVDEQGERHLLGFDLGGSEEEAFWLAFLRSLLKRGLKAVQLVISDAHEGLKKALSQVFTGASWQRCRVHFMRNQPMKTWTAPIMQEKRNRDWRNSLKHDHSLTTIWLYTL